MRPASRLLSFLLVLILLGSSLVTVSAHSDADVETDGNYGVTLGITRTDTKTAIQLGTILTFTVVVVRVGPHSITDASLSSVTPGGYAATTLDLAGRDGLAKDVKYRVSTGDLPSGTTARIVPIRFKLTFTPGHINGDAAHTSPVTVVSNEELVPVTRAVEADDDEKSEVELFLTMNPPNVVEKGKKVTFTMRVRTGKYGLRSSRLLYIRKQLYDADGEKIGGSTRAVTFSIRPYKSRSLSDDFTKTYTLKQADEDSARIEFTYEFKIEYGHLRFDDGSPPELESDFEEVFEDKWVLVGAAAPTPTPTPAPSPTPASRVVGTSVAATVSDLGDYIHVNRRDGGQDFVLTPGYLAPNGGRSFNRLGYVRDDDPSRGGQTYAVVRRESDNQVVRMWISPESPERHEVPWNTVTRPPYTVPVGVLSAILLDETRPVENQLARRFDANTDGRIYVFRNGAWHWVPDIPTFEAEGFFWCDVTAADSGFFRRANIGAPLPASGTAADPNYPPCHSK